ncbi:MAG: hypothetical protein LBE08_07875 [Bifidobacteriaceae bacterium]|nr:hypothetical protein [Bifidobacteriaceae bacterium]
MDPGLAAARHQASWANRRKERPVRTYFTTPTASLPARLVRFVGDFGYAPEAVGVFDAASFAELARLRTQ